ncbi:MAG: ISNCY family transposase [Candidatus Methylomirabilota bacterium]
MTLTPEDARRVHVLTLLEGNRLTPTQAAEALGLSLRQVRRLRGRLRRDGPAGVVHGNRGRRAPNRLPAALQVEILAFARGRYAGLNDHHLTEKLTAVEGLVVSRATVQRLLRAAGLGSPRRRRPPRHRQRRPRRAQAGLLLQLDGSPFPWFGATQPPCSLVAAIDDATGAVLAGTFRAHEDAAGYLRLLQILGTTVGLPAAVYTDAHGIFVRNDSHWTLAEQLQGAQAPTQVGRALQTLGIHHLVADSPQAKGRIERCWNTFQDRLPGELALAGITTPAAGDRFLATTFLPAFNARFAVPAAVATPAYRPVPRGVDLARVCAFHYARQVARDNTVRVDGVVLQLAPGPHRRSYARAQADVVQCLDGAWRVYVGEHLIATTPAPPDPGQLRARRRR